MPSCNSSLFATSIYHRSSSTKESSIVRIVASRVPTEVTAIPVSVIVVDTGGIVLAVIGTTTTCPFKPYAA